MPAGEMGTALAVHLASCGHNVTLYNRNPIDAYNFNNTRENITRLKGIRFSDDLYVKATADLVEACNGADLLVFAPTSSHYRTYLKNLPEGDYLMLSVTKGLELDTNFRTSQVIEDEKPDLLKRLVVLSGPNIARGIANGQPAATVLASNRPGLAEYVSQVFDPKKLRPYTSYDVVGVEYAGSFKTVISIAAGISDGLGKGANGYGGLIVRSVAETTSLGVRLGGDAGSFYGIAGLGDILASTRQNELSRNYSAGISIGRGEKSPRELLASSKTMEGLKTSKAVHELSLGRGVEIPIMERVYRVIFEDLDPEQAIEELLQRPLSAELASGLGRT